MGNLEWASYAKQNCAICAMSYLNGSSKPLFAIWCISRKQEYNILSTNIKTCCKNLQVPEALLNVSLGWFRLYNVVKCGHCE